MNAFDRFADWVEGRVASGLFFAMCVLLIVIWLPSFLLIPNLDTWQLIINTLTTIVTFLLVALLQNSTRRNELAVHQKLDAVLEALGRSEVAGAEKDTSAT